MNQETKIDLYFIKILENIDNILYNDFYDNKYNLESVRNIIDSWYQIYKQSNSLKNINYKEIEYVQFEIYDIFNEYFSKESIKDNFSERVLYYFEHLEHFWKDDMLGGKKNAR